MTCIRVLVADDHELVRQHICTVLGANTDMEVVSQAASGYEAIHQAGEHQPDVVLLDLNLPELNGLLAAPMIKKAAPRAEILIVTSHHSLYFVRAAFKAGARGFLSKADIHPELIDAVRQVHAKQRFVGRNSRTAAADLIAGEATG
ncbi:MAG TPA: response regulator transcription factor [Terriglobales bacterium]|nr:response regulator transcription factor [Terriglobales bacterium]